MDPNAPLVIINPAAGGGSGERDWGSAVSTIRSQLGPFQRAFTESPGHATQIAREESLNGRRLLIAFGGDGTISEIARGILDTQADTELGVLPHGTGSDFVRSLEIPSRLADAARSIRDGRTVRMDVGKVTYRTPQGTSESRYYINSSSFGLSGEVAENTNRSSKSLGGLISFASSTLKTAFTYDPPDVYLELDDEPARRVPITTVCCNNGRFFGGGMKIAPDASMLDGRLDLVIVRKLPFRKILAQGPRLYAGAHMALPEVHHRLVSKASAWSADPNEEVHLEVDGESPGQLPARFEACPKALFVRVPGH
jgi:YegS/Rv2252/BmrU family lipid kinase